MNKKVFYIFLSILLFLTGRCPSKKDKEEAIVSSKNSSLVVATTEEKRE